VKIRLSKCTLIFGILGSVLLSPPSFAVQSGITYTGRLLNPDLTPVVNGAVSFRMQIRSPDSQNCLMYEEVQTKDLSQSGGAFSITINDGTGTRTDTTGYTVNRIFGNQGALTFVASTCSTGSGTDTYTPNASDGRAFQVYFKSSAMSTWEPLPEQSINFAPMAIEAQQVGGFPAATIVRVADPVTGPSSVSALTPANYTTLLALIGGTSTQYVAAGSSGATMPSFASNPSTPLAGDVWFNSTSHTMEYYDGTTTQTIGSGGGGGVTSITAGTGLSGGTITTTGTISLPNTGTVGTYTKVTTDAQGRVTTGAQITGSDITSGTIGGTTVVNTSGTVTASSMSGNSLLLYSGTKAVTVNPPAGLATAYNFNLPASAGSSGQVLLSGGGGASPMTWGSLGVGAGGTGITSGTSGGIPYFNGTSTMASSALLTANQLVIGGGAGAAPSVLAAGTQGQALVMGAASPAYSNTVGGAVTANMNFGATATTSATTLQSGSGGLTLNSGSGNVTVSGASQLVLPAAAFTITQGASSTGDLILSTTNNKNIDLTPNGTGNVGIGTANPGYPLQIGAVIGAGQNPAGATDEFDIFNTTGTAKFYAFTTGSASASIGAWDTAGGAISLILNPPGGNVGVGTSNPVVPFQVHLNADQNVGMQMNSGIASIVALDDAGTAQVSLNLVASQYSFLGGTGAGNIGIGTTSPAVSLDLGTRTDALRLPNGTTAQQPTAGALAAGEIRYNTNGGTPPGWVEYYNGSAWTQLTSGGSGSYLPESGGGTVSGNVTITPSSGTALTLTSGGETITAGGLNVSGGIAANSGNITGVGTNLTGAGAMTVAAGGTNQNLTESSSGTGVVNIGTGNGTGLSVLDPGAASADYVTVKGAASGGTPVIGTAGSDSNINLTITPKGSGNTIFSSGNVGIGTATPTSGAVLTVNGSTVLGTNATISGQNSTAMGSTVTVSGNDSTAMGYLTNVSGAYSMAMGQGTLASGNANAALGNYTTASGRNSISMGNYSTAAAFADTAIGQYNVGGGTATSWVSTDPVFEVGIGASAGAPANALTVLKNGNVGIGTTAPATTLDVNGPTTLRQAYFESVGALGALACGATNITGFTTNLYTLTACASGATTLNIPTISGWPTGSMAWNVSFFVTGQTASVFNVTYSGATTNVFWDSNSTGGAGGSGYTGFAIPSGHTDVISCVVLSTGNVYCGVSAQY